MTSLLHHRVAHVDVTAEEAVSYVNDAGPWSRFLVTPWPVQSLVEGAVVLVVGVWAGVALGFSNVWGGLAVVAASVLVALLVAAPGAYTETHREYADRYRQARRVHGDAQARAHPYRLLVLAPLLFGAAGALGGLRGAHQSATERLYFAIAYAIVGFVYACLRIRRARHRPLP
jgi:hypothetical protein